MEKILLSLRNLNENMLPLLRKLNHLLRCFLYDGDYIVAWLSFWLMCYNMLTNNKYVIVSMVIFELFVAICLLRRVGILFMKIEQLEQSLDGAKIKRIELEVKPKE